jgi:hypothetical protein
MEHRSCVPSGNGAPPRVWDSAVRVQWVSTRLAWAWAAPGAHLGGGAPVVHRLALTVPPATMGRSARRTEPALVQALVLEGSTARLPQRLACWYVCCGYCQTHMSHGGLSFACVCCIFNIMVGWQCPFGTFSAAVGATSVSTCTACPPFSNSVIQGAITCVPSCPVLAQLTARYFDGVLTAW